MCSQGVFANIKCQLVVYFITNYTQWDEQPTNFILKIMSHIMILIYIYISLLNIFLKNYINSTYNKSYFNFAISRRNIYVRLLRIKCKRQL